MKNLYRKNFSNWQISDEDFRNRDLRYSKFIEAELKDVDFTGADLRCVDFTSAILDEVYFTNADLRGADFTGADTKYAYFEGTRIEHDDNNKYDAYDDTCFDFTSHPPKRYLQKLCDTCLLYNRVDKICLSDKLGLACKNVEVFIGNRSFNEKFLKNHNCKTMPNWWLCLVYRVGLPWEVGHLK